MPRQPRARFWRLLHRADPSPPAPMIELPIALARGELVDVPEEVSVHMRITKTCLVCGAGKLLRMWRPAHCSMRCRRRDPAADHVVCVSREPFMAQIIDANTGAVLREYRAP